ncbi:MAG: hypothetical protein WCB73_10200 [Pseudonocardiaceae bacterium]
MHTSVFRAETYHLSCEVLNIYDATNRVTRLATSLPRLDARTLLLLRSHQGGVAYTSTTFV